LVPQFPFGKLSFCSVLVGYFLLLVVVSFEEKSLLVLCFLWVIGDEVITAILGISSSVC